jgi:dTDP-L-rhamnose 4-epimerase
MRTLVTGGAGFIGTHLVRALVERGDEVVVLDSLEEQVHGGAQPDLPAGVELIVGDVGDREAATRALAGAEQVVHLAAAVGVGQSMYEIARYTELNTMATARFLEYVVAQRPMPVRMVVASSMSIYGEGEYTCEEHGRVALRFFNVYGPGQALSNPYTGVAAIFASRLLNGRPPVIFEDGEQSRDFTHVSDIVRAIMLALASEAAVGHAVNLGTGRPTTVRQVADVISAGMGLDIEPVLNQQYRAGDIRHCFADPARARELLGFEAKTSFEDGMAELVQWLQGQEAEDKVDDATQELAARGLAR